MAIRTLAKLIVTYQPADVEGEQEIDARLHELAGADSNGGGAGFGFGLRDLDYFFDEMAQAEAAFARVEAARRELEGMGTRKLAVRIVEDEDDEDE